MESRRDWPDDQNISLQEKFVSLNEIELFCDKKVDKFLQLAKIVIKISLLFWSSQERKFAESQNKL